MLPPNSGGYTVGVLVQSNFGGLLTINGAPVGQELARHHRNDGSIMIVVATDAPLDHRNLSRLASRAMLGLGRTGSFASNGSGDYVIAFSTQNVIGAKASIQTVELLGNDAMSPLFQAVVEATEEAIYNSLLRATTVVGVDGHRGEAIPLDKTVEILRRHNAISLC